MQTVMYRMCKQQVQGTIFSKWSEVAKLCLTLCNPMIWSLLGSSTHAIFPGKSTGVGCHCLLQRIFPTQRSNPGLLHCRQTLYHLSHKGNPGLYSMAYHRAIFNVLLINHNGKEYIYIYTHIYIKSFFYIAEISTAL